MSVEHELRQVLAELELVSHVSAVNLDSEGGRDASESIGGKRPTGGIDREGDHMVNREDGTAIPAMFKSVEHFRRRMAKARSERALQEILADAQRSLEAHRRRPAPQDSQHPQRGDFDWKRWVAESPLSSSKIASKCGCTAQYVRKVRAQYRDAA